MSVSEAQKRISSREFTGWLAYFRLDPYGNDRSDLNFAMLCSLLANIHRAEGAREFTIDDFMPKWDEDKKKMQTAEEMMIVVKTAIAAGQKPVKEKDAYEQHYR